MDKFDQLIEDGHSLDRQMKAMTEGNCRKLELQFQSAKSDSERTQILDEIDALFKPFEKKYEALGEALGEELNRPWYKFW